MSTIEYPALNLMLVAAIGGIGLCELARPVWFTQRSWRNSYASRLLYLRGGADLIVAGLLLWPTTVFAGTALLLAIAVTVATALLIDGNFQLALVPIVVAVAGGANGYLNVR